MPLYVAAKRNAYFLWNAWLERVVFHLTAMDQSFVLGVDRECCMYWLPRVVGMNTALEFGYLKEKCLYITLITIGTNCFIFSKGDR